jgi:hypothetical protein
MRYSDRPGLAEPEQTYGLFRHDGIGWSQFAIAGRSNAALILSRATGRVIAVDRVNQIAGATRPDLDPVTASAPITHA